MGKGRKKHTQKMKMRRRMAKKKGRDRKGAEARRQARRR